MSSLARLVNEPKNLNSSLTRLITSRAEPRATQHAGSCLAPRKLIVICNWLKNIDFGDSSNFIGST